MCHLYKKIARLDWTFYGSCSSIISTSPQHLTAYIALEAHRSFSVLLSLCVGLAAAVILDCRFPTTDKEKGKKTFCSTYRSYGVLPEWERNRLTGFSYVYTKAKQHLASISTIVRCWWTCKRPAVSPAPELCPFYIFFLKKTICQLLETIYDIGRSTSYCRFKKRHTGTAQKRNYRRKKIIPQGCNNVKCVQLRTLRII